MNIGFIYFLEAVLILTYTLKEEQLFEELLGEYTSYGIEVYDSKKKKTILTVKDVFAEKEIAIRSVQLFNCKQPDMIHFYDILESIIADPEEMIGINYGYEKNLKSS